MITDTKPRPGWKPVLRLALKIYAGFCTFVVTAYLVIVVWCLAFAEPSPQFRETQLLASYGEYVANESPRRADRFMNMAAMLGLYSRDSSTPLPVADVLKYLGKPDLIAGTTETGSLVYLYEHSGTTNQWAVFASLKGGKLVEIGFNDARALNDSSTFRAYPTP